MKFNKKCQILHFNHNKPCRGNGLGQRKSWLESDPEGKNMDVLADSQMIDNQHLCPDGQEGQCHLGLYKRYCGQQEQDSNWPPLLGTGVAAA